MGLWIVVSGIAGFTLGALWMRRRYRLYFKKAVDSFNQWGSQNYGYGKLMHYCVKQQSSCTAAGHLFELEVKKFAELISST
jgi:hypothetical protein